MIEANNTGDLKHYYRSTRVAYEARSDDYFVGENKGDVATSRGNCKRYYSGASEIDCLSCKNIQPTQRTSSWDDKQGDVYEEAQFRNSRKISARSLFQINTVQTGALSTGRGSAADLRW